jgi:hypothetical protein
LAKTLHNRTENRSDRKYFLTIVPVFLYGAVRSGFAGDKSITRAILGWKLRKCTEIDPCLVSRIVNAMHVHPADDALKDIRTHVLLLNPVDPGPPLLQTLTVEGNSQRF